MTVFSENSTTLNANNPWPGLAAYDEASATFFFGRQEEADELFRFIRSAPLTVVYGKSGLGKTSLLQAGLYPKLRAQHYLPIHIRLEYSDVVKDPPFRQVMRRFMEELDKERAEYPEPRNATTLWEYLHRKDLQIWSRDNFPLTPVLVFDQFEELFTLRQNDVELITNVMSSFADLIENRFPPEITNESPGTVRASLDLLSQHYRIVLSFREDFLPEVQAWEQKIPSLLKNYLRLNPMSRQRAIDVILRAGKDVLDENVASSILDLVGKREVASNAAQMSEMVIEPVLLSLCCSRLNARRNGAKIDQALVKEIGQDILDDFYQEALDDDTLKGPPDAAQFIEDNLIQGDHFRGNYPKEDALNKNLLTQKQLAALTDKHRLLRIVPHTDTARVELIHDRLVPVVRKAREERKIKQHQEEQEWLAKLAQAERDRERARSEELQAERDTARRSLKVANLMRNIAAAAVIITVILAGWGIKQQVKTTTEAQKRAEIEANTAVALVTSRLAEGRLALGPGLEPLEQMMYRGLAAYRLTQGDRKLSQARAASLTALHSVMESTPHLRKAVTIQGLVPTPALAYSPDGKTLAVGGEDGTIRLLETITYREIGKLVCELSTAESVWALAYNRGGTRLVAGYSTNTDQAAGTGLICVFNVQQRKQIHRFEKKGAGDVYSVAYSGPPEGEFIVSGGSDKMVRQWDLNSGTMSEFPHEAQVSSVTVSPDNRLVVSGGDEGIIRIWNRDKPKMKPVELTGHGATVQQVVFSPTDPNLLISAGDDGLIIAWNIKERCRTQQSKQQLVRIYNFALSRDGLIAAASADGYVRVFRLLENAPPCSNTAIKRKAATAPSSPEFPQIQDGELVGHGGIAMGIAFNPEGTRLASTGQDSSIRIWGQKTPGFSLAQLQLSSDAQQAVPAPGNVSAVAISPNGQSVVAGDENGTIYLWRSFHQPDFEPISLSPDQQWHAHDQAIRSLALLHIGNHTVIFSGGDDGLLKRWDAAAGQSTGPDMEDQAEPIQSIAVSPNNQLVAAGSRDGTIRLWDIATGRNIRRYEKPLNGQEGYELHTLSFTADGKYLAIGDSYPGVRILDLAKPENKRILQGHMDSIQALARGNKRWLLSAGADGRILEWDPKILDQPAVEGLRKHDEFMSRLGVRDSTPLTSIDTSGDGKLILAGGRRGRLELWDGDEHVQISTHFSGHQTNDIQAVALALDGTFFVTADASTILIWPGPDQWADIICSKLDRNMSDDQWQEWVSKTIPPERQCRGLPWPLAPKQTPGDARAIETP